MKTALHSLVLALQAAGTEPVPEWLQLVPTGTFRGVDGRGPYVNDAPQDVVALFESEGRRLPVDENHATDVAPKLGLPSPARGWIVAMEVRDGSIWGKVEWTSQGRAMVTDHAYGFLSPTFLHPIKPPFRVIKLTSVALTNNPNLHELKSLHSQQETAMLEELRKALGLPETATEAEVMAAVTASRNAQTAQAALMARVAEAAGVAANTTGDALVTAIQSAKTTLANGDQATEITQLEGQVKALHSQLTSYVQVTSLDKATHTIDQAIKDGKVIPALRDHYIARHVKDAAEVEKEITLLPSLHAGGLGGKQPPRTGDAADEDELKVAALMGVDPTAFAATHKAIYGKGA